ncbi:MAG: WD40/YVTN/BNR-like repeat-containing protein, partial [Ignavibacteria bacterium]
MKIIYTLFITAFISLSSYCQPQAWLEQNSGVTVQLTSVSVSGQGIAVWICGYNGTVLRTTNSGNNWINVSGNGIPSTVLLVNTLGIGNNTALTAGYIGSTTYVYRTSNAGANWTQVFTQANGFINAIVSVNQSTTNLFMQGDPVDGRWSLWRTTNGGVNWDSSGLYLPQAGAEAGWNNSMFSVLNGTMIWFGTNNSRIYYSTNGGLLWTSQSTAPEANSYAVWFFNFLGYSEGLMGGATLMRTSNYGSNWTPMASLGTGNFGGISGAQYPVDNPAFHILWYVRGNNNIYFSYSGGQNWQVEHTAPAGNYRHLNGRSYSNGPWYAVRTNGGISYHGIISGIQPVSNESPGEFNLYQNYPNPFNP